MFNMHFKWVVIREILLCFYKDKFFKIGKDWSEWSSQTCFRLQGQTWEAETLSLQHNDNDFSSYREHVFSTPTTK